MSDFRIQRAINAASNTCSDALEKAYEKHKTVSKNALVLELMRHHSVTPRAAVQIVDIAATTHFDQDGDNLIPKKGKA